MNNEISLVLIARDGEETELILSPSVSRRVDIENISSKIYLVSDREYKIKVTGLEQENEAVQNMHLMINEETVSSYFAGGLFYYLPEGTLWNRLFEDCYGFVRLSISFQLAADENKNYETYSSGLISVLVKKGPINSLVRNMVRYVSDNYSELIAGDFNRPSSIYELREEREQNLDTQLVLAEEIAKVYERNFGYFVANPRYKTKVVERVDHVERMQYASAKSLQFTIQHPEYLQRSPLGKGIRFKSKNYIPDRTLTGQLEYTEDIYENRLVVSFLRTMIENIRLLKMRVERLLERIPEEEYVDENEDYVLSTFVIYESTVKVLHEDQMKLNELEKTFERLFDAYYGVLRVRLIECNSLPMPTAVFLSIPQYIKVYQCMVQWFTYGNYEFSRESYLLAFIKISSLYETYTLAKLIQFFKTEGFCLDQAKRYIYPRSGNWKYIDARCCNTFCFSGEDSEAVIYYQPVIYSYDSRSYNGIGIYRNSSVSLGASNDRDYRGEYYVPDFLIKYVKNGTEYYIIGDAKFSSYNSVLRNYVTDLSYKYIVSMSPVADRIKIAGLFINYGKDEKNTVSRSVYDKEISDCPIHPFFEIIPISELTGETQHFADIEKLFGYINRMENMDNSKK